MQERNRQGNGETVQPAPFRPPTERPPPRRRLLQPLPLLAGAVLLVLLATVWFVFTARAVTFVIEPEPDTVAVDGGLAVPLGGRWLMRPGRYRLSAEKAGYHRLEADVEVAAGEDPVFDFTLEKLPGRLTLHSEPAGASVVIDGEAAGETPLREVTLEPGPHQVLLRAERYRPHREQVVIEGMDRLQELEVALVPNWADIAVSSEPPGATLTVDGEPVGKTPLTAQIGAGVRTLTLSLESYRPWERELEVVANEPQTLSTVELEPAPGQVKVTSEPAGASVSVADAFQGRTPLTVEVPPGRETTILIARAGYQSISRKVSADSGETRELAVELEPVLGTVRISSTPQGATLLVDGQPRGSANREIALPAREHRIEIRKEGYRPYTTTVTPKPGFEQLVRAALMTPEEARFASIPEEIETATGARLRLVQPGSFTTGSPRREQGRRANEVRRDVELTRPFYMGVHEVTNAEFRRFRSGHSSGIAERRTLDNDDQPVVRVSWRDAVAYCNWLSRQEGLPEAYRNGQLITPVNTGYRLPTEAEWAWAARFAGGRDLKYPWGDEMPPTGKAGNYADTASSGIVREHLTSYTDGFPVAAPVGEFSPNVLGLYDLGGNVSEWVNDHAGVLEDASGKLVDPTGVGSGEVHVIRGSSWRHGRITALRLAYRDSGSEPRDDVGFRIARYAK